MKQRYILGAVLATLMVALVPVLADDSEAVTYIDNDRVSYDFDNMDGGYITFHLNNSDGGRFKMTVTVTEGTRVVGILEDFQVASGERDIEVTVSMPDFKSVGTHTLTVTCTPANQFGNANSFTMDVTVDKNILSNWVTYVVIIIVIIVVVVFAYLKIRDQPKNKTEMTFEQLEAERKAEMAAKSEGKKKSKEAGPSTERQRYLASKKKKE